jgi:hypothetical protein
MSGFHARADASANIVLWIGVILAVLIIFTWYFQKIYPLSQEINSVNTELDRMQSEFSKACNSIYYKSRINPKIEKGFLSVSDGGICINTTKTAKCRVLLCANTNLNANFNLAELTNIILEKNSTGYYIRKE